MISNSHSEANSEDSLVTGDSSYLKMTARKVLQALAEKIKELQHNPKQLNFFKGNSNFETQCAQGRLEDKSLFIQHVIENPAYVILILRPRRFGKTLNMQMLERFLMIDNSDIAPVFFEDRQIWQTDAKKHQGKHPVLSISFYSIAEKTYLEALLKFIDIIKSLCQQHSEHINSETMIELKTQQDYLKYIQNIDASGLSIAENSELNLEKHLSNSLAYLIQILYHAYQGKKVYLLIDEYDTPIQHAFFNGYYDKLIHFFKNLFIFLKGNNSYLEKTVFTGIQRISKEGVFSDLNNLTVFSAQLSKVVEEQRKRYSSKRE